MAPVDRCARSWGLCLEAGLSVGGAGVSAPNLGVQGRASSPCPAAQLGHGLGRTFVPCFTRISGKADGGPGCVSPGWSGGLHPVQARDWGGQAASVPRACQDLPGGGDREGGASTAGLKIVSWGGGHLNQGYPLRVAPSLR